VADAGIRFAMIRVGNRTVQDGIIQTDRYWEENIAGARDAGLLVGVYFYSQAITVEEAREEAMFVLDLLDGIQLDFPVVFDWEHYSKTGRNVKVDAKTANECAIAFCEEISKAGYDPMIYFNLDLANRIWDLELLRQQGYPFWLALYRNQMNWEYRTEMWQYTESGSVPGIDVPVDLNLYFFYD
jgi:GH25 family lysozyme M1 (1,4-beta-N-acetylmuramidase)